MAPSKPSPLNPTVLFLGFVSFLNDLSSEMLYPITPLFLTTVLSASMTSVGLIEGVAEGLISLLRTYSGAWSDRLARRRIFLTAGYLLSAVAKPLIGGAQAWPQVLVARSLDRTGKALRTAPRDAMLAEAVPGDLRGAAFGWHRGMDTAGAALGPLLALLFLQISGGDLRSIYFWAFIPGLLAALFTLRLKEKTPEKAQPQALRLPWRRLPAPLKKFVLIWGLFSVTNSSDTFLLLKAREAGLSATHVILLYCLYNLVYALASPPLGHFSDRVDRRYLLAWGLVAFALVYGGFMVAESALAFALLFALYGVYMAATEGIGKALAVDLAPQDMKATGLGLLGTVTGLGTFVASVAGGLLWDYFGAASTFGLGAIGALVASLLLFMKF